MKDNFEPVIIAFCCKYCAYAAADLVGSARMQYPPNIRIIRVPCTGRLDVIHILKVFENGVDGVYVAGCLEGECHYLTGNLKAKKRIQYVKNILVSIDIEHKRLEMFNMSAAEASKFAEVAKEMTERIRRLGSSPLKSK